MLLTTTVDHRLMVVYAEVLKLAYWHELKNLPKWFIVAVPLRFLGYKTHAPLHFRDSFKEERLPNKAK